MSLPIGQRYYGKYRGEVVADRKDTRSGKKYPGQVTVKVHNLPHLTPRLAEPCYPQGSLFVPKVGDQVWVEFEEGNPTKPIWTGILYPEDKGRPEPASGKRSEASPKEIWTRSGHVVTVDDEAKKVEVSFKDKSVIKIDDNGVVLKCGSTSIEIKSDFIELKCGKSRIKLDSSGTKITDQSGALKPAVLDGIKWLNQLMSHTHPTAMGPTAVAPQLGVLSDPSGVTSSS